MAARSLAFSRPISTLGILATLAVLLLLSSDHVLSGKTVHAGNPVGGQMQHDKLNYEMFASYWTLEPGWRSTLELRNNDVMEPMTVTPLLRTAEGHSVQLAAITLGSSEVKLLDLRGLLQTKAPELVDTNRAYGAISFRYLAHTARNFMGSVIVEREGSPINFHFDADIADAHFRSGSLESIWWLPNDDSTGIVIANNVLEQSLKVEMTLFDGPTAKQLNFELGPHKTKRFLLRDLVRSLGIQGRSGGLSLKFDGAPGALHAAQVLFNEHTGFSAIMKVFERNIDWPTELVTLRAPMVALKHPDPVLGLGPEITLDPQVLVRNASPVPLSLQATADWRNDITSGRALIPVSSLQSGESRLIHLSDLQGDGAIPENARWATISFAYNGIPGDIVAEAASFDSGGRYGLQSPFSERATGIWAGGMWHVDETHDTLIMAGNAGDKTARVRITLHYSDKSYIYDSEPIAPGKQVWVDIRQLVQEQVADRNGITLPPNAMFGSEEIEDLNDVSIGHLYVGLLMIDTGPNSHISYHCHQCCGYQYTSLSPDPAFGLVGEAMQMQVVGTDCLCHNHNLGGAFNWNSSNTSVAGVNSSGVATCFAAGTCTISSQINVTDATTCSVTTSSQQGQMTVQKPTYFFSPSAKQTSTPSACGNYKGYFIDVSYYVADANSNRISQSGMAPGENVGSGWNDAFATPPTTASDGSFDDTPVGACYGISGHFCAAGHPQSFRLTNNGTIFPIATNTTSKECTDGIELDIKGNPIVYVKTYLFGNTQ